MHRSFTTRLLVLFTLVAALSSGASRAAEEPLRVLFLGDQGHHRPADRFAQLQPVLADRGIELVYTERLEDLNPQTLSK